MQIEKSKRSKRDIVASRENEESYDRNFKMAAMPIYGKNHSIDFFSRRRWSGGAMVLGKLPVPGRPTIWITVGQRPTALAVGAGPTALAVGAGWGLFGHFYSHLSFLSSFSLSLGDGPI